MKKIISLILVILLITNVSAAFASNLSKMTDKQLMTELNDIRNELAARGYKAQDKKVIVDHKGFQIYINGEMTFEKDYVWDTTDSLFIPIVFINNSSHNTYVSADNASINGWSVDCRTDIGSDLGTIPAGKKAKGFLIFSLDGTDVAKPADFSDVEFSLSFMDYDSFSTLLTTKPIAFYMER